MKRLVRGLIFVGAATLPPALLLRAAVPDEPAVRLLAPTDHSTVTGEQLTIVVTAPATTDKLALALDGRPLAAKRWKRMGAGAAAWVAEVKPREGNHVLTADGRKIGSFRRAKTGNAEWPLYRAHPLPNTEKSSASCALCHGSETNTLAMARTPAACETCHEEAELPLIHRHVMDPFARCQSCHNPHGSPREKLLVDAKEKLCIRCHEAGHSKP